MREGGRDGVRVLEMKVGKVGGGGMEKGRDRGGVREREGRGRGWREGGEREALGGISDTSGPICKELINRCIPSSPSPKLQGSAALCAAWRCCIVISEAELLSLFLCEV